MQSTNDINDQFAKASTKFALESYLNIHKKGNFVFSPASLQLALTLTSFGAAGVTKEEMLKGLKLPKDFPSHAIAENCETLMAEIQQTSFFNIANKMYLMQGYTPKEAFNNIVKKSFASETQVLDFSKSKESAAVINKWADEFSNHKIKEIIQESALNALTTLVLVNGIYFKAPWYHEFYEGDTTKAPFFMDGGKVAENVSFMAQSEKFAYAAIKELDATAVKLPFKQFPRVKQEPHGQKFAERSQSSGVFMLIILPNRQRTRSGLSAFENKFKNVNFDNILKQLTSELVNLKIPKFKIESNVSMDALKETLTKMGMRKLFTDNPDFSNLLEQPLLPMKDLFRVAHKAYIAVDEKGAEAAALTVPVVCGGGGPPIPKDFVADHPFLFAIMKENKIMFLGRVSEF